MKATSNWRADQSLSLLLGQALMLMVSVVLVLGSCAVLQLAQG
jgi:hypothetical protein